MSIKYPIFHTGKGHLMFFHGWEPKKTQNGKELFSTTLIFPKEDTASYERYKQALREAYDIAKQTQDSSDWPAFDKIVGPVRDCRSPRYPNHWELFASSKFMPVIADRQGNPIKDRSLVRDGSVVQLVMKLYPQNTHQGFGFSLDCVRKLEDESPHKLSAEQLAEADRYL